MYIVQDKTTKQIIHRNPAPLEQELSPVEVYHAFDAATMEIGRYEGMMPAHWKIDSGGMVCELSDAEKIAAGILTVQPNQKVQGGRIVEKTRQDRVDDGLQTLLQIREEEVLRLRGEVEAYLRVAKTVSGYRLDNLARQKAAMSLQYRELPAENAQKSALLSSGMIYEDAGTDEILAAVQGVQAAYASAKAALDTAVAEGKPVAQFEAVRLENYLG